jgi:predicted RNA-binding Zn-ribbon protein involved in translation (DUF1610 family)
MAFVSCPGCGRHIEVYDHEYGTNFECAECGAEFVPQAPTFTHYAPPVRRHTGFECPFCHTDNQPFVRSEVSTIGWVFFFLLLSSCVFFWLCWLPLVTMKREFRQCSSCGIRLD